MCGRTSIGVSKKMLEERFQAKMEADFKPTYNAAPSQNLPIIKNSNSDRIELTKWGFLPKWLKDKRPQGFINTRIETILEKPSFRTAVQTHRCLVPADGFYEWKLNAQKIPFRITLKNKAIFAMAGIWESWCDQNNQLVTTYSIITTAANSLIKQLHDRMPVILPLDLENDWLTTTQVPELINHLTKPFDADSLDSYQVSNLINSPKNNSPQIIEKVSLF